MNIRLFKDNETLPGRCVCERERPHVSDQARGGGTSPPLRPGGAGQQHEPGHGGRGHGGQAGSGLQAIIMTAGARRCKGGGPLSWKAAWRMRRKAGHCMPWACMHTQGWDRRFPKGDRKALVAPAGAKTPAPQQASVRAEGFQRAIAKPFGCARRRETPCAASKEQANAAALLQRKEARKP